MPEMLGDNNLWILNVLIDPSANRKQQEFTWLTQETDKKEVDQAKL
jgi:hypothetical protein